MPDALSELPLDQQYQLQSADPELHALLSNTATATLELAALNGTLAEQATTPQERQDAAIQQEIEELIASEPWGRQGTYVEDPNEPTGQRFVPGHNRTNFTNQQRLMALAPEKALVLEAAAKSNVADPGAITEDEAARINARLASMRAARLG